MTPSLRKPTEEQRREAGRLDYEALIADANERLKHQVDLGKTMIQSLTVVNGGAIVALFTLVGKQGGELALDPSALRRAFALFVAGLVFALAAAFAGFMSQYFFALTSTLQAWNKQEEMLGLEPKGRDFMALHCRGNAILTAGIACAAIALLCFALGSWSALSGVLAENTTTVAPD